MGFSFSASTDSLYCVPEKFAKVGHTDSKVLDASANKLSGMKKSWMFATRPHLLSEYHLAQRQVGEVMRLTLVERKNIPLLFT